MQLHQVQTRQRQHKLVHITARLQPPGCLPNPEKRHRKNLVVGDEHIIHYCKSYGCMPMLIGQQAVDIYNTVTDYNTQVPANKYLQGPVWWPLVDSSRLLKIPECLQTCKFSQNMSKYENSVRFRPKTY